jgi:hypothetical protein
MVIVLNTGSFTTSAARGCVILNGAGVALTLSPAAALKLADQLTDSCATALGQQAMRAAGEPLEPD